MLVDITPISRIDWESKGARFYSVRLPRMAIGRVHVCRSCGLFRQTGQDDRCHWRYAWRRIRGTVALKNLVTSFDPNSLVSGRLIVVPVFSVTAFYADQREAAADGVNMNRAFPGRTDGTLSFRMARFLTDEVLSRSDVVIDIHSGGRGFQIVPTMSFHSVDDPALRQQFKETAFLFGTPFTMIYTSSMGTGLLTEEAEKMGKITIGSELGYGASTDLDGVRWAHQGLLNVMRHYGLVDEPVQDLRIPQKWGDAQRLVQNIDIDTWVTSPIAGFGTAGPARELCDCRYPGGPSPDFYRGTSRDRYPGDQDGYVLCRKFRAKTEAGRRGPW